MSLAYPALTIEDFERGANSAITLTGEIFNLAIPTINSPGAFISSDVDISQTTIPVLSTAGFPTTGTILLGKEIITYNGKTTNSFLNIVRGSNNTQIITHTSGDYLKLFD